MLKYFFILILSPLMLYLFLTIPLSVIVKDVKPIYIVWSAPGIWIVTTLYLVYLFNFSFYERNFNNEMMKSTPVQSYQYLFASYLFSLIIGLFQLLISIIIISSLNSDYISFINLLAFCFLISPAIIIISCISCVIYFFVNNKIISLFSHIMIFLLISFGLGSFIPIDRFPEDYMNIVQYFPISGTILNFQKIISSELIFFNLIFVSFFYLILFGVINLLIIDKSIEGNK
jgi:hypothetical protein